MKRLTTLAALLTTVAGAGCFGGSNTGKSTITGKIVLSGQQVPANTIVTLAGPTSAQATAGSDGAYKFEKLPAGTYAVLAQLDSTAEGRLAAQVKVEDSKSASAPDLTFQPLGQITGTATLGQATGNAGIVVAVPGTDRLAVTDDAGHFTISDVPSGSRDVYASLPGRGTATKTGLAVPYKAAVDAGTLTLQGTVTPTGSISGTVTVNGASDASAVVLVLSGPVNLTKRANADGTYSFPGLPDGTYVITATGDNLTPASQTQTVNVSGGGGASARLFTFSTTVAPTGSIAGTVSITGATDASGVVITLSGPVTARVTTPASGAYSFANLPAGDYLVTATGSGLSPSSAVKSATLSAGAAVTGIDFQFAPSTFQGSIAGTVSLVGLTDASGVVVNLVGPVSAGVVTQAAGTYSFTGLPDGTYLVTASATSSQPANAQLSVTVSQGGAATGQDFAFQPVGSLSGHVQLNGQPVVGASVAVAGTSLVGVTIAGGSYSLSGIPAGAVTITALAQGAQPATVQTSVTRGQSTTLDITLQPAPGGAQLSSQVSLPGQANPAGILVSAGAGHSTVTDPDGGYTVTGLNGGTYQLAITSEDGGRQESFPVLAVQNSDGFYLENGVLVPLAPIELEAGQRQYTSHKIERMTDLVNGYYAFRKDLNCNTSVIQTPTLGGTGHKGSGASAITNAGGTGGSTGGINPYNCVGQLEVVDSTGTIKDIGHGNTPESSILVSPQTQAILFMDDSPCPTCGGGTLYEHTALGTDVSLGYNVNPGSAQLSPDGTKAAIRYYNQLLCVDLTTAAVNQVFIAPNYINQIQWANNSRLVWSSAPGQGPDPYSLGAGNCDVTNVQALGGSGYNFFLADNGNVAVTRSNGAIALVPTAGGTPSTIGTGANYRPVRQDYFLTSSNGGDLLLFTGAAAQLDDGDGGTYPGVAVTSTEVSPPNTNVPSAPDGYVYVTGDGMGVVYEATNFDDGGNSLYAGGLVLDGGSVGLPYGISNYLQSFYNTSNSVVVADATNGFSNTSVVSFDSALQPSLLILENDAGISQLGASGDGGRLVYETLAGQLVGVNIDGTGLAQITTVQPGNGFQVSQSGDSVMFTEYTNDPDAGTTTYTIKVAPTAGGTVVPVVTANNIISDKFSENGKAILVMTGNNYDAAPLTIAQADGSNAHTLPGLVSYNVGVTEFDDGILYLADVNTGSFDGTLYVSDYTGTTVEALTGQSTYNNYLGGGLRGGPPRQASQSVLLPSSLTAVPLAPGLILSVRGNSPSPYTFQDGAYLIHWP